MHIVIDARNRRASTGRYTDRLIEHLQELDGTNNYTVLIQSGDPWEAKNDNFVSVSCDFQQFSFNPIDQLRFAWQLYRLKPDLVHFTMTQQPILYFGKIVTTTHDLTMLRFTRASRFPTWLHNIGMGLYRFLLWQAHKKSDKIIVPTQFVADDLASYQPFTRGKIVVTYESSEPPIAAAASKLAGANKPFIFHVGSPFPHKNIERLIKAFEILKTSQPELKLILPGKITGKFKHALDSWISVSPVKDSIIVPGFITDEELKWLYQNAECYVLPSLSEGFGLPGLEAMAHGCPVASSNATCLPEVYQDAALYFDPYDPADIAEKVKAITDKPDLAEDLVAKGKKLLPKYSWRKMAQETLDVYESLAKKG
jgi:glycosyltransferase involved in cell wall biosynthesis